MIDKIKLALLNDNSSELTSIFLCKNNNKKITSILKSENLDILLFQFIKKNNIKIHPSTYNELYNEYKIEKGYQMMRLAIFNNVVNIIGNNKIILLKGFSLNSKFNLDLYKRSIDIDFLIEHKCNERIIKKLSSNGFTKLPSVANGEFLMKDKYGIVLDIHYNLSASSSLIHISKFRMNSIFTRTKKFEYEGFQFSTLDDDIYLIYLCLHFSINHQFNEFILLYEIIEFIKLTNKTINWAWVLRFSKKHNLQMILYITFLLINEFSKSLIHNSTLKNVLTKTSLRNQAKEFYNKHKIPINLLNNKHNGIHPDDLPKLSAHNFILRRRYNIGNRIWADKKYL
jgi:hypothetical protein